MQCPKCENLSAEAANFCETCGAPLTQSIAKPPHPTTENRCRCGAGPSEVDEQGYCTVCGINRARTLRDHRELRIGPDFAAITDRGLRHSCNEDDMALGIAALEGQPAYILVVCDGLSSAQDAEDASSVAAQTACESLLDFARSGGGSCEQAISRAIQAAHHAVCALEYLPEGRKDPPETTIVAAVVRNRVATIGWVGDSRAYWIGRDGAGQLTRDHSWINEVMDVGEMSADEALLSQNAHAITRCLGAMNEEENSSEPSLTTFTLSPGHGLLLCSDGLWNYTETPEKITALIQETPEHAEAIEISRHLVEFACASGGHDNITVAVLNNLP